MKQKLLKILSFMMTLCLTLGLLIQLTQLMERKASVEKYKDFFEQEADFDVFFMGTSHVINGIFPMELWNDYGIVSFNFGGHASRIPTSYWVLRNALKYSTPKVVVIDAYSLSYDEKCADDFSYMHYSWDAFPLSIEKVKAVWDLLDDAPLDASTSSADDGAEAEPRTKLGLLWDYSVYHSRWNEISEDDFDIGYSCEKGAELMTGISEANVNEVPQNQKLGEGSVGDTYLREMIEYCQSRNIEVLLTYLPFGATDDFLMESNYVRDVAEEYQVPYINFFDENLINYQTDLHDSYSHLNASGARKVTDYLGKYLTKNYELTDHRFDDAYAGWYDDYNEYTAMKYEKIHEAQTPQEYLMLLYGEEFNIKITIGDEALLNSDKFCQFISNLGIDVASLPVEELQDNASIQIETYLGDVLIDATRFACSIEGEEVSTIGIYK